MAAHCFKYSSGAFLSYPPDSGWSPCGPVNDTTPAVACCVNGDSCLSGSICSYTHSLRGGSGYYAAGCTDEDFSDPSCKSLCSEEDRPDVTYESASGLWACCGTDSNGDVTCMDPTNETFNLDAPKDLAVVFQIPATGFAYTSAAISTAISSSTSSPTGSYSTSSLTATSAVSPSTTPEAEEPARLSSGAAAGIGVGVAVGVLIAGILAWVAFRRFRRGRTTTLHPEVEHPQTGGHLYGSHADYKPELPESSISSTPPAQARNPVGENGAQEMYAYRAAGELP
ncbi:hypothetical protein ANO14919_061250 [Xylariales sp. No.14919]|nr:hypothetical protein ANO14919_061250 [Xylariales sp. No.14919]